ncbi:MAG: peptidase inhibitor family I36 protein [Candidatus Dormibacteria bacterium]
MRIISKFGVAAAAAALFAGVVVSSASATTTTTQVSNGASAAVAQQVRGLLAHNAGSIQVSADAIRLSDGSTNTAFAPSGGMIPDSASGRCPGGHLCLFVNSNWGGDQWTSSATSCGFVNLSGYFLSNGSPWTNQASSIDNPEPRPGGSARFYHNGAFMLALQHGHYLRDLSQDSSATGGNANDKIDTLYPC